MAETVISRTPVHYGRGGTRFNADKTTYRSVSYIDDPQWGQVVVPLKAEEVTGDIVWFKDDKTGARRCEYQPSDKAQARQP